MANLAAPPSRISSISRQHQRRPSRDRAGSMFRLPLLEACVGVTASEHRDGAMAEPPPETPNLTEAADHRTLEELRAAVRARDAFVAIAAHELRNPMTPILMQVHALLDAADREASMPPR